MITESKKRDVALVIDDSPETLRLLTDALDGAGMTVMVAMDGAAAMRIVEQITPDIVLLDAVMPGMDGFETCRRLKRDAGLSNVPVIFMTVLADKLAAAGTDDELALPQPMLEWLEQAQKGKAGSKTTAMALFPDDEQLRLQYMGKLGPNEFLLRLAKDTSTHLPAEFSSELGLTTREGEVLSWLSKGKTNRDIAQILGLSPRTVDKHLEQIYAKLGVENRTAAAAIATSTSRRNS